ncbi:MAG: hypothetical protein H6R21_649 [Proteobacteria bacterium]|nr:hypothetical protein [Pseudomonadota bacterium]RPJ46812.1 MAG: DUF502 domain-containing protein [Betaproteobacteria bacterium]
MLIKRGFDSIVATWLAGLVVFLPLALTLAALGWLAGLLNRYLGPDSAVGHFFSALGYTVAGDSTVSYLLGTLVLMVAIYLLGLALRLGLRGPLAKFLNVTLRRIPLVGGLYDFTHRFVGLLEPNQGDIGTMSAVWCFFGGDGVAVLALAPGSEPIDIDGRRYFAVLVPTAPVPIGGGLLYVPVEWVKPANMGIDKLTEIYVSMGLTPPPGAAPESGRTIADAQDGATKKET